MKITQLKQQLHDENRVSIFVDDSYAFSLTLDQVLEEKIKKGIDIDDSQLERLRRLSDERKIRDRTLEWLLSRPHSEREVRTYLLRKKVSSEVAESIVQNFTEKGYLDDKKFAEWFVAVRLRKNKSTRAIQAELTSKGISSQIVAEVMPAKNDTNLTALKNTLEKARTKPRYQDIKKLTAYLLSKGFSYHDIKTVLDTTESD
jgi:regulatory protein